MGFYFDKVTKKDRYGDEYIETQIKRGRVIFSAIVLMLAILLMISSFTIVPTGYTGVRITFGQIDEQVVQTGFNWKIPLIQRISKVNNKQQDEQFAVKGTKIWGETSEKVPVYMADVTVTYQISSDKSAWIYSNVTDYRSTLLSEGIVASALKEAAVGLATETVTNRGHIESAAVKKLQEALDAKYGDQTVRVINIVINDMDFEGSYNEAINARSLAQKSQETQKIQNETNIAKAKAEADAKKITAQGTADARIIEAESEAKSNKLLEQSLTDNVLRNRFYDLWDGKLPNVMTNGTDIVSVVDVSE